LKNDNFKIIIRSVKFKVWKGSERLNFRTTIVLARFQMKAKPSHSSERREEADKKRLLKRFKL
jgi:hypothetical protein